jgi:RNA polymerase sigma-70 factor, ECF subfamily
MRPAFGRGVRPSPIPSPVRSRLPLHLTALRQLQSRGTTIAVLPGEEPEQFQCRIETALMALFRERQEEIAFAALYDFSRANLLEWISGLLNARRRSDPLEILQDTFVNIYRYASSFRDEHPRSFRVWSRTIAGNLLRRETRRSSEVLLQALPEGLQEPVDSSQGPLGAMMRDENQRLVVGAWMIVLSQYASAYRELGARDRLALELVELQGLSYAQAGARLRVGNSNMKMIMFRARRRLRARIGAALEDRRANAVAPAVAV